MMMTTTTVREEGEEDNSDGDVEGDVVLDEHGVDDDGGEDGVDAGDNDNEDFDSHDSEVELRRSDNNSELVDLEPMSVIASESEEDGDEGSGDYALVDEMYGLER